MTKNPGKPYTSFMAPTSFEIERDFAETELSPGKDFVAAYMALGRLVFLAEREPGILTQSTVRVLLDLLSLDEYADRKTAYFLYRKAAKVLAAILSGHPSPDLSEAALLALSRVLCRATGPVHRATAEALGALPLSLGEPRPPETVSVSPVRISWEKLLLEARADPRGARVLGRSVALPADNGRRLLVVKFARAHEDPSGLAAEAGWMELLRQTPGIVSKGFLAPRPLSPGNARLLSITGLSAPCPDPGPLHPDRLAVAFLAAPGYFTYPNEAGRLLPADRFVRVLNRNARVLGRMAGAGILHTAPIPLFHNRVQRHRRDDRGLYHWPRAGRLDQWLASCDHPNVGVTGPRDFEHLEAFSGNRRELYIHAGNQILALALVAGSWFRNQDPDRRGAGPDGRPADTRDLFDPDLLARMLAAILSGWCQGFSGAPPPDLPVDHGRVARAMIAQMGVDRDMVEIFRVHDQQALSDADFSSFLAGRGFTGRAIRGQADITLVTGPHLGGFNQRISVPELIEFTATATGLSMAQRFLRVERAGLSWTTEEAA